jgi:hypothetical protein
MLRHTGKIFYVLFHYLKNERFDKYVCTKLQTIVSLGQAKNGQSGHTAYNIMVTEFRNICTYMQAKYT